MGDPYFGVIAEDVVDMVKPQSIIRYLYLHNQISSTLSTLK